MHTAPDTDHIACTAHFTGHTVEMVEVHDPKLSYAQALTAAKETFPDFRGEENWQGKSARYFWRGAAGERMLEEMGVL
jgi:hypothetical protein